MEEDLKILEKYIKEQKEFAKQFNLEEIEDGTEGQRRLQVIENLIARNKKLEKCLDEDLGNIINLGILLSEHAEKPKDKNIYIDEAQVFLNTLDYYYIPKSKVQEILDEYGKQEIEDITVIRFYKAIQNLVQEGDK